MNYAYLSVFTNNKLQYEEGVTFKVMIVGQPSWHLMDWNGCNFRRLALPKQYRKTFTKEAEAKAYCKQLETMNDHDDRFVKHAASLGDGAWFDERWMV